MMNKMEIYIVNDLTFVEGAYRANAVYAFKSKRSVKSYERYTASSGEDHKLIVTPCTVQEDMKSVSVVTEFVVNGELTEYMSTEVFEDYDDARDYVANVKETEPTIHVEHDIVKIRTRFTPD